MSHTALVCDDTMFMRSVISQVLTGAGFDIVGEAENGAQAIEKYQALKPDFVTMDIVMPETGGIDAVRAIVKEDPSARIVMCSAIGQKALLDEALEAGAKEFVIKPFQPAQLLDAVNRALE